MCCGEEGLLRRIGSKSSFHFAFQAVEGKLGGLEMTVTNGDFLRLSGILISELRGVRMKRNLYFRLEDGALSSHRRKVRTLRETQYALRGGPMLDIQAAAVCVD